MHLIAETLKKLTRRKLNMNDYANFSSLLLADKETQNNLRELFTKAFYLPLVVPGVLSCCKRKKTGAEHEMSSAPVLMC